MNVYISKKNFTLSLTSSYGLRINLTMLRDFILFYFIFNNLIDS